MSRQLAMVGDDARGVSDGRNMLIRDLREYSHFLERRYSS